VGVSDAGRWAPATVAQTKKAPSARRDVHIESGMMAIELEPTGESDCEIPRFARDDRVFLAPDT